MKNDQLFFAVSAVVLSLCVLLGGATRAGGFAEVLVQLASVPLLLWAVWRLWEHRCAAAWPVAFVTALALVPLGQLVPLPPVIWTSLPFRELAHDALLSAGQPLTWRPLTLTPHATWLSLAALIPAASVFLAVLFLPWRQRRRLVLLLLALAVASSFLGLIQVARWGSGLSSGDSLLGAVDARGFFDNRNHFAALLYSSLLFAAAYTIDISKTGGALPSRFAGIPAYVPMLVLFAGIVVMLAAVMLARSRAGITLSIAALLGIVVLARFDRREGSAAIGVKRLVAGAVLLVFVFSTQFALYRVMQRFAEDTLGETRIPIAHNTWEAAQAVLPFGAGMGSFVPVYKIFEKTTDTMVDVYVNRAHNDGLEILLETGVAGLVLMIFFAVWLFVRLWQVWREAELPGHAPLDLLLTRAATLVVLLLLAHSLVDYPLRTTALLALFAFACALLIEPLCGQTVAHEAADIPVSDKPASGSVAAHERPRSPPVSEDRWRSAAARGTPETAVGETSSPSDRDPGPGPAGWAWPDVWKKEPPASPDQPVKKVPSLPERPAERASGAEKWGEEINWPEAWRNPAPGKRHGTGSKPPDKD